MEVRKEVDFYGLSEVLAFHSGPTSLIFEVGAPVKDSNLYYKNTGQQMKNFNQGDGHIILI